jgi:hypothetical protein
MIRILINTMNVLAVAATLLITGLGFSYFISEDFKWSSDDTGIFICFIGLLILAILNLIGSLKHPEKESLITLLTKRKKMQLAEDLKAGSTND